MEKHKGGCQQGRKKVQLSMRKNAGGGGGVEGAVMFGGALAFASLVAAFTLKKCNKKDSNKDTANLAATDSCEKDEDGAEGLRFILHESSSTQHQNSCCTNQGTSQIGITQIEICELVSPQTLISSEEKMQCEREDSVSGHGEILIHDTEQESIAITGDVEEISEPVSDHEPMNVVENESDDSLVMETIEIEREDDAVDADAEQAAEETSALQSSLTSVLPKEEEKSSFSTGENEEEEEYSLMQLLFSTEEEDREEEEYSLMQSLFSTEEEEQEEEEYSSMRSSFSSEEEDEEEYSPVPSFSTEEEDGEENSPMESLFSTEEEEEEEEEEDDDDDDDDGEDVTEMEEESGGTWSSSTESNMEAIWPSEMLVLSPESKEINISHGILSVKKFEKDTTGKIEDYLANTVDGSVSKDGKNQKETQELVVLNDKKEHSARWQIWVWLGFVLVLLILLASCLLQRNYLSNSVSFVFPMK